MSESVIPKAVHASHIMGVDLNKDGKLYDLCIVCNECACHSESALLTPCDDIAWVTSSSYTK